MRTPALSVLGTGLGLALGLGCQSIETEVSIGLEFPRDDVALSATNNVTVTLAPDGFSETFAVDGPAFELEVELEPDNTARSLSVFLAQDELLLGYGRTPFFSYSGATDAGLVVFLGFPGTLATLDRDFDLPDAGALAAPSFGRGAIALGSDGSAVFIDAYTYELFGVAPLPEPPASPGGAFVGDTSGSVTRVVFEPTLAAHRYVFGADAWVTAQWEQDPGRAGAASWYDTQQQRLYICGGGEQQTVAVLEIAPPQSPLPELSELAATLDGPRHGAAAFGLPATPQPELVLVGGDDPALPLIFDVAAGQGYATPEAWTGLQCVPLGETQTLCAGGIRADAPSPDGVLLERGADGSWDVEMLDGLLSTAMRDVAWLADELAVYAQGSERLVRIDRADLTTQEPAGAPARSMGGSRVVMPTGVTLLVGGQDEAGSAVGSWQVFSPELSAE